jgi:hypothetical protein
MLKILMPILVFFGLVIVMVFFVAMLAMPIAMVFGWKPQQQEMYNHCIADGVADYQCYAMTHRGK